MTAACLLALLPTANAQQGDLPYGSDADHKRLIEIRAQSQKAQRDAQIAALRRTATQSTEKSNRDKVLEKARLDKEYKRRAALAVQQQQAVDAYKKVKQSEIDSWNGKGQGKITAGVPADFTASLPPLEEEVKKKGLLRGVASAPGRAVKGLASLRPGFFRKKNKKESTSNPVAQFAPPESLALDKVVPRTPEPASVTTNTAPVEQPKKRGFRIPLVSSLTGGKKKDENPYDEESDNSEAPQKWQDAYPEEEDVMPGNKKSFFSRIPLVGNKNKKQAENADVYYGPDGAGEADITELEAMEDEPKSGFLSKLSLKKNKSKDDASGAGGARKNIYVVDTSKAQFFPFGESGKQAAAQSLGEGTLVRMTKSGDDWSSIELSSGSIGVVRNKHLRRAKANEVPANMFAHAVKAPYPTTARISKPRSATGKGASHRYREPVNVPLPDLPEGGNESGALIGNGLLPPLEKESTIQ